MSMFITILVTVLIFGVLVVSHEFGHFIAARKCGVDVLEFSVGMGPLLWKRKKDKTQYSLRLIPIGGFCRMNGEDPEEEGTGEGTLYAAPAGKRMLIMAAGALMNFAVAVVIFFVILCMVGNEASTVIDTVSEGSAAYEAGIVSGDTILSIDGDAIDEWDDITDHIRGGDGSSIAVSVKKASGETVTYDIVPRYNETEGAYLIGITPRVRTNVVKAFFRSFYLVGFYIVMILRLLGDIIRGSAGLESFTGPIGATVIIGRYIPQGIMYVLEIAASISVSLGLFNLLPIPALDGSRLLFSFIELLRGKPVDRTLEAKIHTVGMIVLMGFAVFIAYRDVVTYIL